MSKRILITGVAGFIGFHLALALLKQGNKVVGIDNLNDYYDPSLKEKRLESIFALDDAPNFSFIKMDISDRDDVESLFASNDFDVVVNLAAQAGVRYSIENPSAYIDSNLVGFANILEGCRQNSLKHFVYASSSSVYGISGDEPLREDHRTDSPVSLYAATKKSNEVMAEAYSHLYSLPITGLRFFTVYGPYGRPDMAYFGFTKSIIEGSPINLFNNGDMFRDFTFIDDIVDGMIGVIDKAPISASSSSVNSGYHQILNIGNNDPVSLRRFISAIELCCSVKAKERNLPMQPGDVYTTYADIDRLYNLVGFKPKTKIEDGIKSFVDWYIQFYGH